MQAVYVVLVKRQRGNSKAFALGVIPHYEGFQKVAKYEAAVYYHVVTRPGRYLYIPSQLLGVVVLHEVRRSGVNLRLYIARFLSLAVFQYVKQRSIKIWRFYPDVAYVEV